MSPFAKLRPSPRARSAALDEGHPRARILVAEDDDPLRDLMVTALRGEDYEVTEHRTGGSLFDELTGVLLSGAGGPVDLVISDIRMPEVSGLQVMESLNAFSEFPPVILITAFGSEAVHDEARRLGAFRVLDKPFELADLLDAVRDGLCAEGSRDST